MPDDSPSTSPAGRVTLQDIADEAGVSRATVSLILANRSDYIRQFRPETVARVREVAEKLGYRGSLLASSLRSLRSSFFGLVVRGAQGVDAGAWQHQAFEGAFIAGVLARATAAGIYPVVATQDESVRSDTTEHVNAVLDGGVFGAIFRSPKEHLLDVLRHRIERGLPMISVFPDRPTLFESNMVDMDNRAAGRLAGELLARAGRKRWCVIQDYQASEAQRLREDGIREAARLCGATISIDCVPTGTGEEEIVRWFEPKLRSAPPDGVFSTSSVGAVGVLLACDWAGVEVPEQTCIIGCDASLWRVEPHPKITSIEVSWYDTGRRATELLLHCRDHGISRFDNVLLRPTVVRGMTCPVPDDIGAPGKAATGR